jgi:hypothetical protein
MQREFCRAAMPATASAPAIAGTPENARVFWMPKMATAWMSASVGMSAYSYDASNSGNACYKHVANTPTTVQGSKNSDPSPVIVEMLASQRLISNTHAKDSRDITNMRNASEKRNTSCCRTPKNIVSRMVRREASNMGLVSKGIMRKNFI